MPRYINRILSIIIIGMICCSSLIGILSLTPSSNSDVQEDNRFDIQETESHNPYGIDTPADWLTLDNQGEYLDARELLETYRSKADSFSKYRTSIDGDACTGLEVSYDVLGNVMIVDALIHDYSIATYNFEEGYFDAVFIPEMELSTNYGVPVLPYSKIMFNVPTDLDVLEIRVSSQTHEVLYGLDLVPGPKPLAIFGDMVPDLTLFFDPEVYESSTTYPSELVDSQVIKSGEERALMLTLHPLQYNPIEKQGLLHTEISIEVLFTDSVTEESITFNGWSDYQGASYTIITTDDIAPILDDFIDWKTSIGFDVFVETVSDILSGYSGRDNPEKVRSFITDAYATNATEYFLLIGDCDLVPAREVWDPANAGMSLDNGTEPSDLYYECLDGDWDANDNDIFGEFDDDVDLFPEVKVGRLPIQTSTDAQRVLTRIISYESDPEPGDWMNDFMLIAVDCFGDGDGVVMSEGQLNQKYLFDSFFDVFRYYPTDGSLSTVDIVTKINSGINIVNFFDHGAYDVWVNALDVSDVLALNNGNKTPFAFAMACETAAFDVEGVEPTIGEAFFRATNGGASTYIGATRIAWAGYDCFDGFHNLFWEYFFTEALANHEASPKDAFHDALNFMATNYDTSNGPTLETIYHAIYFGDPALRMYWKHNVTIATDQVDLHETVTVDGTCLQYNNKPITDTVNVTIKNPLGVTVYSELVSTNSLGQFSIEFTPDSLPGDYTVVTRITQPFASTSVSSIHVGKLDVSTQLDGLPIYNTFLNFSGNVNDDCNGNATLLDSSGNVIHTMDLTAVSGEYSDSINITTFGWLKLYIQFDNGSMSGGSEIRFKVSRGDVLVIGDNAGTSSGPDYPGGWADDNFGDASNPGDYVLALKDEYDVTVYFTMHESTPALSFLQGFDAVIVSTGDNYGYPLNAPMSYLLDVLYEYHNTGGNLLFEGASILYSLDGVEDSRFSSLFHVEWTERTTNTGSLELVPGSHPIVSNLPSNILLANQLGTAYADVFAAANGSLNAAAYGGSYSGGSAITGLSPSPSLGGVVFIGFSIDAIADVNNRNRLIANAIEFLLFPSLVVLLSDNALKSGSSETIYLEAFDSATETPIEGASVSLSGCGISVANTSKADGTCSVFISPTSSGLIDVHVTKAGYLNFSTTIIVYDSSIIALDASPSYLERSQSTIVTFTASDYYEGTPLENCFINVTGLGNSENGYTNESGMISFALMSDSAGIITATGKFGGYIDASITLPVRISILILPSAGTEYADQCCWDEIMLHWDSYGDSPLYIDYTSFQNESLPLTLNTLETLRPDVLHLGLPPEQMSTSEINAIKEYIESGHGFIIGGGALHYNLEDWAEFLGLADYGTTSVYYSGSVVYDLIEETHPLFNGLEGSYTQAYPMTFYPLDSQWDSSKLDGGMYLALHDSATPYGAIIAYRGMVLFTGLPEYSSGADDCQIVYNALIWSNYEVPEHDLSVTIDVPATLGPGESTTITASVQNKGTMDETNVVLTLLINGSEVDSISVPVLLSGHAESIEYPWAPFEVNSYNITAYAEPVDDEYSEANNYATQMVSVRDLHDYMMSEVTYTWYDAFVNGVNLDVDGDDESVGVVLPFEFQFYDNIFDTVYVSSNGWLSFENDNPWQYNNVEYPTTDSRYVYSLAPMWADLIAYNNIWCWATEDRVVIEFREYYYLSGGIAGTFEVVFYENGLIQFNYQTMGNIYDGTVGLNHGDGIHYNSYDSSLLSYTTEFSLNFLYKYQGSELEAGLLAPSYASLNEPVEITAIAHNIGNSTEYDVELTIFIDDVVVDEDEISSLAPSAYYEFEYIWIPTDLGLHNVCVYVTPVVGELMTSNNAIMQNVSVEIPRNFEITSPTSSQTVRGGLVLVEYTIDQIEEVESLDVSVNDEDIIHIVNITQLEVMVPVFQNGTNLIELTVQWNDTRTDTESVTITSTEVVPLLDPELGDFYNWYQRAEPYSIQLNYTFSGMIGIYEVGVDVSMAVLDENNVTIMQAEVEITANTLNGYISSGVLEGSRLFFITGLRSPTYTNSYAEIGDVHALHAWFDNQRVTSSSIWESYAIWRSASTTTGQTASIFRSNGILATVELDGENLTGWVTNSSYLPAVDNNPPEWLTPLEYIVAEAGQSFVFQFDIFDDSGLDSFTINDTVHFVLTLSGQLSNVVPLHVGSYGLELTAIDPFDNTLIDEVTIQVIDTISPTWIYSDASIDLQYGSNLEVYLEATDFSGIDHWSVNDTRFSVNTTGWLINSIDLDSGVYTIEVAVFDLYNNYNTLVLTITLLPAPNPFSDVELILRVALYTTLAVAIFVGFLSIYKKLRNR
ncbi:MAG: hypothetical protein JW779_15480 [Candidatus Thorarchaeota archaeon]|nr:hypothetical protein [Candidatus Thorarchaeota archaeon]